MIDVDIAERRGAFQLDVKFTADAPIVGLFGRSGAGKTTVVNAIAGVGKPSRGTIRVNGHGRTLRAGRKCRLALKDRSGNRFLAKLHDLFQWRCAGAPFRIAWPGCPATVSRDARVRVGAPGISTHAWTKMPAMASIFVRRSAGCASAVMSGFASFSE